MEEIELSQRSKNELNNSSTGIQFGIVVLVTTIAALCYSIFSILLIEIFRRIFIWVH